MSNAERLAAGQEDPDDDDGYQAAARTLRSMKDAWVEPATIEMDDLFTRVDLIHDWLAKAFALGMLAGGASLDEVTDVADHASEDAPEQGWYGTRVAEAIREVADDMFSNAVDDGALEGA